MFTKLKRTLSGFWVTKRRKRRKWSDGEKRKICAQTRFPGVSVSQVARRYDVNANQVFNWLKDPQFEPGPEDGNATCFYLLRLSSPHEQMRRPLLDWARSRSNWPVAIGCGPPAVTIPRHLPGLSVDCRSDPGSGTNQSVAGGWSH